MLLDNINTNFYKNSEIQFVLNNLDRDAYV